MRWGLPRPTWGPSYSDTPRGSADRSSPVIRCVCVCLQPKKSSHFFNRSRSEPAVKERREEVGSVSLALPNLPLFWWAQINTSPFDVHSIDGIRCHALGSPCSDTHRAMDLWDGQLMGNFAPCFVSRRPFTFDCCRYRKKKRRPYRIIPALMIVYKQSR